MYILNTSDDQTRRATSFLTFSAGRTKLLQGRDYGYHLGL
jgi:hypothetical protein